MRHPRRRGPPSSAHHVEPRLLNEIGTSITDGRCPGPQSENNCHLSLPRALRWADTGSASTVSVPTCCRCNRTGPCKGCVCVKAGRFCVSCLPRRLDECRNLPPSSPSVLSPNGESSDLGLATPIGALPHWIPSLVLPSIMYQKEQGMPGPQS